MKSGANQHWGIGLRDSPHDDVPRASPKSIYRLADKVGPFDISWAALTIQLRQYDIPDLKSLALSRIREELERRDIVKETFSSFTSK